MWIRNSALFSASDRGRSDANFEKPLNFDIFVGNLCIP